MAIELRYIGATNWNAFDKGDSVLNSVDLSSAMFEMFNIMVNATKSYNQDNPDLLYPVPTSSKNDTDNSSTLSVEVPFRKIAGVRASVEYIDGYSGWIVPTTGELAGKKFLDALIYLFDAGDYGLQKLQESVIVKNAAGLVTVVDDNAKRSITASLPFTSKINATGAIEIIAINWGIYLDLQESLPL
jgi:hypothetical protein